jgi:hypothetical protein
VTVAHIVVGEIKRAQWTSEQLKRALTSFDNEMSRTASKDFHSCEVNKMVFHLQLLIKQLELLKVTQEAEFISLPWLMCF